MRKNLSQRLNHCPLTRHIWGLVMRLILERKLFFPGLYTEKNEFLVISLNTEIKITSTCYHWDPNQPTIWNFPYWMRSDWEIAGFQENILHSEPNSGRWEPAPSALRRWDIHLISVQHSPRPGPVSSGADTVRRNNSARSLTSARSGVPTITRSQDCATASGCTLATFIPLSPTTRQTLGFEPDRPHSSFLTSRNS